MRLNLSRLLVSVGHKTTDKVRLARVKSGHELTKRDEVDRGHCLATASLLLLLALILLHLSWLARMISPEQNQELAGAGGLEDLNNSVVNRILVLLQPAGDIVGHNTSVVRNGEVSILISLGLGLQEDGKLAKRGLQLLLKGLVSGLGEERLLLEDGPDTHGLLKHDDGSSKIHAKVNHLPVNALLDVFLLLNNKHVVVEKLLELLVDKVNGDLLETVVLENLETSNIEHSAEVGLLEAGVNESGVTFVNQPLEETVKDSSGNTSHSIGGLLTSLTLGHPLSSDLDPGLAEGLDHSEGIHTTESSSLAREGVRSNLLALSLVITTLGLELHTTTGHDRGSEHVAVILLRLRESENIEGIL